MTVQWPPRTKVFRCVPAQISAHGLNVVAAPGEQVAVPPGRCVITIDMPGYVSHTVVVTVGDGDDRLIYLKPERLSRRTDTEKPRPVPPLLSVNAVPWTPPILPPRRSNRLTVEALSDEVRLTPKGDSTVSCGVEVIAPRTPSRLLAVPPMQAGEDYYMLWRGSGVQVQRPTIEPGDDEGRLLMEYLLKGQYALASAAARALACIRGEADPLSWAMPSYTQLLIGYAHALGRDWDGLARWCERTAAASELGSDGLVLAAEDAWERDDPVLARQLLAHAASMNPPTITLGGELALDLATSLALRVEQPVAGAEREEAKLHGLAPNPELDGAILALSNEWTRKLARADTRSLSLSIAETKRMSPDLEQAPWLDKLKWLLRWLTSFAGYTRLRAQPVVLTISKELLVLNPTSFVKRWLIGCLLALMLIIAVAQVVVVSEVLKTPIGPIGWFAEGTLLAIIVLAIGAYAAASVYREMVIAAEQRADEAKERVRDFHEAAMKGRALAAVLKADAMDNDWMSEEAKVMCRRHAAVADQLEILEKPKVLLSAPSGGAKRLVAE